MNGYSGDRTSQDLNAVLQRAQTARALFLRTSLSSRMNQTKGRGQAALFVGAALEWVRGRLAALHAAL